MLAAAALPAGIAATASASPANSQSSTDTQLQLLRNATYANGVQFTETNPTLTKNYSVRLHNGVASGPYGDRFKLIGRPAVSANVYGAPGALVVLQDKRPAGSPPAYMYQLWLFRVVSGHVRWVADGVALDQRTNTLNQRSAASAAPVVLANHNAGFVWRAVRTTASYRTVFTLHRDSTGNSYLLDAGSKLFRS